MTLLFVSIVFLILLISRLRLHAFVAFIIAAILTGLATGFSSAKLLFKGVNTWTRYSKTLTRSIY